MDHSVFTGCRRVKFTAEGIEDLRYLSCVETGATLEQQVLNEMADAVLAGLLVAGARPDPEA
ncbi:MAG: hypothetical protein HZB44_10555 [Actinobacteria bacterium]|nr:hypothetical protein [Actinomycetota bacterium]